MKKLFTLFAALCTSLSLWAYGTKINGVYYILAGDSASVTYTGSSTYPNTYSGDITIPTTVTYSGKTYTVTSIGKYAFYSCTGLTSITIPNSVTCIGDYAFHKCTGLTSVTFGNSVTSIGEAAFWGCTGLTSITIPNSVTSIGDGAFSNCPGRTSIVVAAGNTKYDSRNSCNAIIDTRSNTLLLGCQNTTIPSSVTSIGDYAFDRCIGLTSITIPNTVTSIGISAFRGCTGLTKVTIGNSVTSIGMCAFEDCTGLTSITCEATAPPTCGSFCFLDVDKTIPLYVPAGSVSLYQAADQWKDFTNIQATTGVEELLDNATDTKLLLNGKVYIRRGNSLYDANGRKL